MSIQFVSTNVGRAKLAESGIGNVTLAKVGISQVNNTVSATTTALANELKKIPISGQSIDGAHVHFSFADNSNDVYSARALGLYLDDDTLFAVYSQSTPIFEKSAGNVQVFSSDTILVDLSDQNISFPDTKISNPPATTTIKGVVELATIAETRAGTDIERAIVPAALKDYIDYRITQGINAATLGNNLPAYYTNIPARLGFDPLPASAMNGVWTSSNDGPNSGLSADTIWNFAPDDLAKAEDFIHNLQTPGTISLPNGAKIKFAKGVASIGLDSSQFIAFDSPFPEDCLIAFVSTSIGANNDSDPNYQIIGEPTPSGVSVRRQASGGGGNASASTPFILAIGY